MTQTGYIDASSCANSVTGTVLPRERIAHLSYGRRLLRCGISNRLTTAWGHSRRFKREVGMTASPQLTDIPAVIGSSESCPQGDIDLLFAHLIGERVRNEQQRRFADMQDHLKRASMA